VAQAVHFGLGGAHLLIAVPAIVLGAVIGVASYRRWQTNQRAMRLGQPIGYSVLPAILAGGVALLGAIVALLVTLSPVLR
jgi:uncharacterized membrane protein YidH (DUF202 family)